MHIIAFMSLCKIINHVQHHILKVEAALGLSCSCSERSRLSVGCRDQALILPWVESVRMPADSLSRAQGRC